MGSNFTRLKDKFLNLCCWYVGSVIWVLIMDSYRKGIKKHTGQACTHNKFHTQAQLRQGVLPDFMGLHLHRKGLWKTFSKNVYKASTLRFQYTVLLPKNIFQRILQKVSRNHTCSKINFANLSWSRTQMTFNRFVIQSNSSSLPHRPQESPLLSNTLGFYFGILSVDFAVTLFPGLQNAEMI